MEPDPLSNQHTLTDNTVHGTLNVSVFGGGTANTEYEVLTSNPISLLSSNLFPYQQIITQERPSFASYLKDKIMRPWLYILNLEIITTAMQYILY